MNTRGYIDYFKHLGPKMRVAFVLTHLYLAVVCVFEAIYAITGNDLLHRMLVDVATAPLLLMKPMLQNLERDALKGLVGLWLVFLVVIPFLAQIYFCVASVRWHRSRRNQ